MLLGTCLQSNCCINPLHDNSFLDVCCLKPIYNHYNQIVACFLFMTIVSEMCVARNLFTIKLLHVSSSRQYFLRYVLLETYLQSKCCMYPLQDNGFCRCVLLETYLQSTCCMHSFHVNSFFRCVLLETYLQSNCCMCPLQDNSVLDVCC